MSEDKLYAVKNDDGKYWDFNDLDGFWQLGGVICPFTVSEENAKNTVKEHGGHIVALIEEPESSGLPWTLSLVSNTVYANRYEDLAEVKKRQNKIGGEIYRIITTVEKLEDKTV